MVFVVGDVGDEAKCKWHFFQIGNTFRVDLPISMRVFFNGGSVERSIFFPGACGVREICHFRSEYIEQNGSFRLSSETLFYPSHVHTQSILQTHMYPGCTQCNLHWCKVLECSKKSGHWCTECTSAARHWPALRPGVQKVPQAPAGTETWSASVPQAPAGTAALQCIWPAGTGQHRNLECIWPADTLTWSVYCRIRTGDLSLYSAHKAYLLPG